MGPVNNARDPLEKLKNKNKNKKRGRRRCVNVERNPNRACMGLSLLLANIFELVNFISNFKSINFLIAFKKINNIIKEGKVQIY